MYAAIRNQAVFSPESSLAVGQATSPQRQAYNAAVEHTLAHPNICKFDLHKHLTYLRHADPAKWGGNLRVQRPGLEAGRTAVRAFDKASATTLRECEKEVRLRQSPTEPTRRRLPKHPVRPGRKLDANRLFKRRKAPFTLTVHDATAIRLTAPRSLTAAGVTITLATPVPPDTDIRAVTITERRSARRRGRNRPLHQRSYRVILIVSVPDAPDKVPWDNPSADRWRTGLGRYDTDEQTQFTR